jgi:CheY-like chemotaxis protein
VVEDNPADYFLIQGELKRAQLTCEFRRAVTAQEFLQQLQSFQPDAVLSDFDLPGFTGLEALALLQTYSPVTPFILVTGFLSAETAEATLRLGASDYVLKTQLHALPAKLRQCLRHPDLPSPAMAAAVPSRG